MITFRPIVNEMKLLPFLFVLLVFRLSAQLRPEIRLLVHGMKQNGRLESQWVGRGFPSENYFRFEELCEKATTKELLKLVHHRNGAVKG